MLAAWCTSLQKNIMRGISEAEIEGGGGGGGGVGEGGRAEGKEESKQ